MKKNMGITDRAVRMIIAVVLATLSLTNVVTGVWAIVLLVMAVIMFLTSVVSVCPLYLPFGLNTLRKKIVSEKQSTK